MGERGLLLKLENPWFSIH